MHVLCVCVCVTMCRLHTPYTVNVRRSEERYGARRSGWSCGDALQGAKRAMTTSSGADPTTYIYTDRRSSGMEYVHHIKSESGAGRDKQHHHFNTTNYKLSICPP